ncbi:GntR family transcriptional regulator [Pseudonocardia alni]|uniref:GntR family transcriptional regulator n=1 Tax=Pseudonocardia alni TaxID=33907 RepID=UPI0034118E78
MREATAGDTGGTESDTGTDTGTAGGSVVDHIVREIGRRVLVGEIPVGSWLRHAHLAEEFGTSRTPVREALRVLDDQGLVTIVRNRGARVDGHSAREVRELGQVRAQLEGFAAELACEHATDARIDELRRAWDPFKAELERHPDAADPVEFGRRWRQANGCFHGIVVSAAGNRQLELSIGDVLRRLPANHSYSAYAENSALLRRNLAEHDAIAEAIAARDPEAARRLMTDHILTSNDATVRWLESRDQLR